MSTTRITINRSTLAAARNAVDAKVFRRILISSINDGGKAGRTVISKVVRSEVNVKHQDVNRVMYVSRITGEQLSAADVSIRLVVKRKSMPMKYFSPRETKQGLSVKIRKQGRRSIIRKGFLEPKLGNHAFKRVGKDRLPITMLHGPTVVGILDGHPGSSDAVVKQVSDRINKRLISKIDLVLSRQGQPSPFSE